MSPAPNCDGHAKMFEARPFAAQAHLSSTHAAEQQNSSFQAPACSLKDDDGRARTVWMITRSKRITKKDDLRCMPTVAVNRRNGEWKGKPRHHFVSQRFTDRNSAGSLDST